MPDKELTMESQQAELHKTIWRITNDLRGSVVGWDFKEYVLGFLFYRFISENLTTYLNSKESEADNLNFDYKQLSYKEAEISRHSTVEEKGFYILPSELFSIVRSTGSVNENLNETLAKVFSNIVGFALGSPDEAYLKGLFSDLISEENWQKILNYITTPQPDAYFARVEPNEEIKSNGYNMRVYPYIMQEGTQDAAYSKKLSIGIARIAAKQPKPWVQIDAVVAGLEV